MVKVGTPPLLSISQERRQRELKHAQEREAAEKQSYKTVVVPLGIFALWQCLGALCMLASASTSDAKIGQVLFTGAFAVGYSGAFFHLIIYYVLGRERGDW